MERQPIKDSTLGKSMAHDPATETLEIEFHVGGVHRYHGVPASVAAELAAAPSFGKHFHRVIKGHYPSERIAEVPNR